MVQESSGTKARLRGFLYLLGLSFLTWVALTSSLEPEELLAGVAICIVLSLWFNLHYSRLGLPPLSAKRLGFFFIYLVVLLREIVWANVDVAYRVLHPRMPINPGIVVVKTRLKSDIAKMILANSITLTPGTFTLDVVGDSLLIHWINVKTKETERATELIGKRFEKYLRVVFE